MKKLLTTLCLLFSIVGVSNSQAVIRHTPSLETKNTFQADNIFNVGLTVGSYTFANLPSSGDLAANGAIVYCSDCIIANPCANAGSGSLARREGGAWDCGGGGGGGGGSGTVNTGTQNQVSYYAANGTAVSSNARTTEDGTTFSYSGSGGISTTVGTFSGAVGITGNLTIPTQSTGDNSTKAASTAFVKAQGYGVNNSGTQNHLAFYAANGTTISSNANLTENGSQLFYSQAGVNFAPSYSFTGRPDVGIYATLSQVTFAITNATWSSGVATLNMAAPDNYLAGQTIHVALATGDTASFNGDFTILTASPTVITYNLGSVVTGVASGGTAQIWDLGLSAHGVVFNRLESSSQFPAQTGSIRFGPNDPIRNGCVSCQISTLTGRTDQNMLQPHGSSNAMDVGDYLGIRLIGPEYLPGVLDIDSPVPAVAIVPCVESQNSCVGISTDGFLYICPNGGACQKLSTGNPALNQVTSPAGTTTFTMTGFGLNFNWGSTNTNKFSFDTSGNPTFGLVSSTTGVTSSPTLTVQGSYQSTSGPAYAADLWTAQDVVGSGLNGTSTLTFIHSGTSGASAIAFPSMQFAGSTIEALSAGNNITIQGGLDNASAQGSLTARGGTTSSTTNGTAAGNVTVRGGDVTGVTGSTIGGAAIMSGGNSSSTNTGTTGGNVTLTGGKCTSVPSATGCAGKVVINQPYFTSAGPASNDLVCVTGVNAIGACSGAGNGSFIGVANGNDGTNTLVLPIGTGGTHNFNATSATFTNGHFVCQSGVSGNLVVDSATVCSTGLGVGIYIGATGTQTSPLVWMREY